MKKIVMSLCAALCAVMLAQAASAETVIKIGHVLNSDHSWHKNLSGFAEDVKKGTEGRVVIQLYPSAQLGNEKDMVEGLTLGMIDGGLIGGGSFQSIDERFGIEALPYAWPTHEAAYKAFDGKLGEFLFKLLNEKGIEGLAWWENGFRHITNSKHTIASLADMNGLKMRVAGSQLLNRSYELWGADYTNANWSEVFTALQTGTYDGQENPLPTADAASIQEVQSYLTYWTGAYDCLFFCMNADLYNSLSDELKAIVDEAGQAACVYERELNRGQDQEIMDKWAEAGVEVTELSAEGAAEFSEASAPVYDEFA